MTAPDVDESYLRSWIGREETATGFVSVDLAQRFSAALNRPADYAVGDMAPPLIHFCLAQSTVSTSDLGDDGHPARGGFLPPVPLPRRMWAGGKVAFNKPFLIGDAVFRTSRVLEVNVKEGRTGRLIFVTVEHTFATNDDISLTERQDIVYREAAVAPSAATEEPDRAPAGKYRDSLDPTPTFLFRYSALTFNSHRIHYDRLYATDVEHYRGLVVHGPLQATVLMNFAADLKGRVPTTFSFRSRSPLFDGTPILLHAADAENGSLNLWTAVEGGPVGMQAKADWA